jgi:carbonic anhydrase
MPFSSINPVPKDLTPAAAFRRLQEGNFRFINNLKINRDLLEQVNATRHEQWPFAAILSCMDSRTSAELIFDQGLGDIFSIRIAGNVIFPSILGSLEYATAVAGSRLILVLGHTNCGAIKGACDQVQMGHLTGLLEAIAPAVDTEASHTADRSSSNEDFVRKVTERHVRRSARQILEQSAVIRNLVLEGKTGVVPAVYDIASGLVHFYDEEAILGPEDYAAKIG